MFKGGKKSWHSIFKFVVLKMRQFWLSKYEPWEVWESCMNTLNMSFVKLPNFIFRHFATFPVHKTTCPSPLVSTVTMLSSGKRISYSGNPWCEHQFYYLSILVSPLRPKWDFVRPNVTFAMKSWAPAIKLGCIWSPTRHCWSPGVWYPLRPDNVADFPEALISTVFLYLFCYHRQSVATQHYIRRIWRELRELTAFSTAQHKRLHCLPYKTGYLALQPRYPQRQMALGMNDLGKKSNCDFSGQYCDCDLTRDIFLVGLAPFFFSMVWDSNI